MAGLPGWFVVVMGLGTVFVGLICIVLLCLLLGLICRKKADAFPLVQNDAQPQSSDRGEIVAAIAASVAEENDASVSGIRIVSIKQI